MRLFFLVVGYVVVANPLVFGQVNLDHPDQFYTNGKKADGWSRDEDNGLRSSFWFAKNPRNSLTYEQQIVIIYDARPDVAYYFDATTKRFVGRCDLATGKYSLLPQEFRRERISDIHESWFPSPGRLPTVGQLLPALPAGIAANETQLQLPPPTARFPRLDSSKWDTSYMSAGGQRVRAIVEFRGNSGAYRFVDDDTTGNLSNVQYASDGQVLRVSGRWSLNRLAHSWEKF